jgi:hypothetical protein
VGAPSPRRPPGGTLGRRPKGLSSEKRPRTRSITASAATRWKGDTQQGRPPRQAASLATPAFGVARFAKFLARHEIPGAVGSRCTASERSRLGVTGFLLPGMPSCLRGHRQHLWGGLFRVSAGDPGRSGGRSSPRRGSAGGLEHAPHRVAVEGSSISFALYGVRRVLRSILRARAIPAISTHRGGVDLIMELAADRQTSCCVGSCKRKLGRRLGCPTLVLCGNR